MGLKPHIFKALNFGKCQSRKNESIVACLADNGYGDCVKRGLNPQAIATHGSAGNSLTERNYHIISNACGHKRALAEMLKRHKESKSKSKYAVLLEDDVAFD